MSILEYCKAAAPAYTLENSVNPRFSLAAWASHLDIVLLGNNFRIAFTYSDIQELAKSSFKRI